MGEKKFTYEFKYNLAEYLNNYFSEEKIELEANPEYTVPSVYGDNRIDIAIIHEKHEHLLIGIEIEIKSSTDQIFLNRDKFRNWGYNAKRRKGGLLHLIYDDSNISQENMYYLLGDSYQAISERKNFFYEFYALKEVDLRESIKTADYLVNEDWEFDARLLALIHQIFPI